MPEMKSARPAALRGLNVGRDPILNDPGDLEVANGVRPLEEGVLSSRNGRVLAGFVAAEVPILGYHPFYDESIVTADDSPKSEEVLYHLYKANGRLYINNTALTGFLSNTPARFEEYDGKVYVADGVSDPMVIRRLAGLTVGQPPIHGAFRMGLEWPKTDDLPTITLGSPGSGGWNPGRDAFSMDVVTRITVAKTDGPDIIIESNPSLVSLHKELNVGANFPAQDRAITLTIDWTALESSLPPVADADRINVWIQVTPIVSFEAGSFTKGEPSAFKKVIDSAFVDANKLDRTHASYDGTAVITSSDGFSSWHELELVHGYDHGAPPALGDIRVVNDTMVGIARRDVVYREVGPEGGPISRRVFRDDLGAGEQGFRTQVQANNVKALQVDRSQVFFSKPFHPEYMNDSVTVGSGSEPTTALARLGRTILVFTASSVYLLDLFTNPPELKLAPVHAGTDSPDSVIETSQMILFRATSGTWYRFNGATFDEVSNEIAPLFRKEQEDYTGYYRPMDQTRKDEIRSTATTERIYITYPEKGRERNALLVGDQRKDMRWALDIEHDYVLVQYDPNADRLLAIDRDGVFYYIEEGLRDATNGLTVDNDLFFEARVRRIVGDGNRVTDWERYHIEADTQGQTITVEMRVDDDPKKSHSVTITTTQRDTVKGWFPVKMRGRQVLITISGTVGKRVMLYGVDVKGKLRGEF